MDAFSRPARNPRRLAPWVSTLLLLLLTARTAVGAEADLVIGSCHLPPLSTEQADGLLDQLCQEAFRRVGRGVRVQRLPCERSLLQADQGHTDGDILRIAGLESRYPSLVRVPEPLFTVEFSCFVTRRDLNIASPEDLRPLRVGYILGWKILEDNVQAARVERVREPEALFAMLADGRVDVVIYERITGAWLIKAWGLARIHALEPPLFSTPQFLYLHRRHAALVQPLAEALAAMRAEGRFEELARQHGLPPRKGED